MDHENLGSAERLIQTLLTYSDHANHHRPGMITPDRGSATGVQWQPVTHKVENGEKVVYRMDKVGKKTNRVRIGVLQDSGQIKEGGRVVAEYRRAGMFPEVVAWMYKQVAEIWKLDNEFSARWASYAFGQEHRDLKVVLAAFMLVQGRKGDPVKENGKVAFLDEDYRSVGEAMLLLSRKDGKDMKPKMLGRVRRVLELPGVAEVNRQLGFGKSAREPFLGRWPKAVRKWLGYREQNPKMLEGMVKNGLRSTAMDLACAVGYRPETSRFFETLRWTQKQATDGKRKLSIGQAMKAAESWEGMSEREICEKIVKDKTNFKRVVGLLPKGQGLTRAIVAAAIESGSLSDKDIIIYTPTLEELGLLEVQDIRERWEKAMRKADDMRAANIATRVKSKDTKEKLQDAADTALKKAVEEAVRGLRVRFFVDVSGSMTQSIGLAKGYVARFLQGFPLDKLHVAVFNTAGREVKIQHASAAGVENAFRGISASGSTDHGAGVMALKQYKPSPDEDELFIFIGDEGQAGDFTRQVRESGCNPMAFGLIKVPGDPGTIVTTTAAQLGIPCFRIDERIFADPYAIPRTIRALIAATPVGPVAAARVAVQRETLVDVILKTDLLKKPAWAA